MPEITFPELTKDTQNTFDIRVAQGPATPLFDQNGPNIRIYRAPIRAFGKIETQKKVVYGLILNVSSEGCLLKTEAHFEIDEPIVIEATLLGNDVQTKSKLEGRVRRKTTMNGRTAYGVEFTRDISNKRSADIFYAAAIG